MNQSKKKVVASTSKTGQTRIPCPECGALKFPQGMGVHMRMHKRRSTDSLVPVMEPAENGDEAIIMMPVRRSFVLQMLAEALKK